MTESKRQQDCPPAPKDPADQPRLPTGGETCDPIPTTTPPTLHAPEPCEPDPDCKCPKPPGQKPTCIDKLINKYTADIAAADAVKQFKTDLDAVLAKAKAADQDYTRDKYTALLKAWADNDANIADLIRKLVCSVPCWKCVVECYVCQVLDEMRVAEEYLCAPTAMPSDVHNIYDLQYWYARDVAAKDRQLQRIKAVLAAWEKPAATIDAVIKGNATLIDSINKSLGTDPGKAVYDVFLKLVPLHLAIAPPSDTGSGSGSGEQKWKTKIGREYTEFCCCDVGKPDDCCGPDVGVPSFRQRLIGPQPYLVDPNHFFKLICCLVEKRYAPAKEALAKASAAAAALDATIKGYVDTVGKVAGGLAWADKTIRPAIPSAIDCCDYECGDGEPSSSTSAM